MLDLRLIREQPEAVQRGLADRGGAELVKSVLDLDATRRRLVKESEELRALRNRASEAIGLAKRRGEDAAGETVRMREVGDRIKVRLASGVIVAASAVNGRIEVVVMATPDAVARGADAGKVMAALNRRLRTRGGGRREIAQGGGGDPALLDGVMADLPAVVREALTAAGERRR